MNEIFCKAHDVRILLLAHIHKEMEQCLLQISCFGVTQLIGQTIDLYRGHNEKAINPNWFTIWGKLKTDNLLICLLVYSISTIQFTLHRYDMEKPYAFPLYEPEFI